MTDSQQQGPDSEGIYPDCAPGCDVRGGAIHAEDCPHSQQQERGPTCDGERGVQTVVRNERSASGFSHCPDPFHTPGQPVEQGERTIEICNACDGIVGWDRLREGCCFGGIVCKREQGTRFVKLIPASSLTTANQQIEELRAENETLKERDGILDAIEHDYGKRVAAEAQRDTLREALVAIRSQAATVEGQFVSRSEWMFECSASTVQGIGFIRVLCDQMLSTPPDKEGDEAQ